MTTQTKPPRPQDGTLFDVLQLRHPQGCCTYLVTDPRTRQALALDVHLDLVSDVAERLEREGRELRYVVDTHTHADHPSGSAALAARLGGQRVAHAAGEHAGVTLHPEDGEQLPLGDDHVTVRHAPGHTPDHLVLVTEKALFSGDSLFIGGVARTDFLGGDAGTLHDTLQRLLGELDDDLLLYPGHDYEQRGHSTIGAERAENPWLSMDRETFVRNLTANPPPRPANMDDLLRLNREGRDIASSIAAAEAVEHVANGGASTIVDVRTGAEFESEHVPGSRWIPLDRLGERLDDVRATPAPRLLLCRSGARAQKARDLLSKHDIGGLTVIEGGLEAYVAAGGSVEKRAASMSLERQVRIAAGSLVLVGLILAWTVHAGFAALSAFVGAGLVFAGITDWCGMGLLLARAPWNHRNRGPADSAPATPSACAATAPPASACAATAPPEED